MAKFGSLGETGSDALCRSVLHGYPLRVQLQVGLASRNFPICEGLRGVVYVAVEDLLRKSQGAATEDISDRLELLLQLSVRRCDGGAVLFGEGGMGGKAAGLPSWRWPASFCGAAPEGGRGHGRSANRPQTLAHARAVNDSQPTGPNFGHKSRVL